MKSAIIRHCGPGDYAAIVDIYNHYIESSYVTFDTLPFSLGERVPWFSQFSEDGPYRLLVAELDDAVAGFCSSTQLRNKPAYDISVETTIYLRETALGEGIGTSLYGELLNQLADTGLHGAFAGIGLPNDASVTLHRNLGFTLVGTYIEVGRKFDHFVDVAWYQKKLRKS